MQATQIGSPRNSRGMKVAILFGLLFLFFLLSMVDLPIAQFCHSRTAPKGLRGLLDASELFGDGIVVGLIVIACMVLDPRGLSRSPQLITAVLGAGMIANLIKLAIKRSRPRSIDLSLASFGDTFQGLFQPVTLSSDVQSFPSGHTATAFGLAIALTTLYPRGKWFFGLLAIGVGFHRVFIGAHFPTDVYAGMLLGIAWGRLVYFGFGARLFASIE